MASVKVDLPFELQNNSPVDAKQNFKTLAEMKNFDERFLSDTAMCTCDEDGKLYIFNKLNTVDTTTGKWREVGASATDLIEKDNTTAVSSKGVYEALYYKETITVVDQEAYYSVCQSTDPGALNVVTNVTDSSTQILLTDINTQTIPEDLSGLTGDGTEYVLLVAEVNHDEEVEKTTYMPRNETMTTQQIKDLVTEASTGMQVMTEAELNTFFDNLVVSSSNYSEPQP